MQTTTKTAEIKIKFCGFTDVKSMLLASKLGADYVGIIVESKDTARSVSLEKALELAKKSKLKNIIAVVTKPNADLVKALDESQLFCAIQINQAGKISSTKTDLWVGVVIEDGKNQTQYHTLKKSFGDASYVVLDSPPRNLDYEERLAIEEKKVEIKEELIAKGIKVAVSGGINENTIWTILRKFEPEVVDITSGIEDSPGVQSKSKMKAIIEAVNHTD